MDDGGAKGRSLPPAGQGIVLLGWRTMAGLPVPLKPAVAPSPIRRRVHSQTW